MNLVYNVHIFCLVLVHVPMYVVFFFGYIVLKLKRRKIDNLFPSTTQSETNVEKVHIISFLFHSLSFLNIYAGKDGAHCFPKLFLSELGVWYLILAT